MTKEDKNLLLALTLGDGCVKKVNKDKNSWAFHINHSVKQRQYIEWKHQEFERILKKHIKLTHRVVKTDNNKNYDILTFSVVHPYFKVLRKYLYVNNEKRITAKCINKLDALGLTILYLDDGSLLHRKTKSGKLSGIAVRLHLSLYEHEIKPVIEAFSLKFGINFTAYKEKSKKNVYLLYANTENAVKFLNIVKPVIENRIKCMRYKIDTKYIM